MTKSIARILEKIRWGEGVNDYKELIEQLRDESAFQRDRFARFVLADELEGAASAIETLLAERNAAVEHLRGDCDQCVYADVDPNENPCADCCVIEYNPPESPDRWQWCGLGGGSDGT